MLKYSIARPSSSSSGSSNDPSSPPICDPVSPTATSPPCVPSTSACPPTTTIQRPSGSASARSLSPKCDLEKIRVTSAPSARTPSRPRSTKTQRPNERLPPPKSDLELIRVLSAPSASTSSHSSPTVPNGGATDRSPQPKCDLEKIRVTSAPSASRSSCPSPTIIHLPSGGCIVRRNKGDTSSRNALVPIGVGNAKVPRSLLQRINWDSYTNATRKLLMAVFSRNTLATHSLTGKPSPAFPDKPAKKKLDPAKVDDVVQTVVQHCGVAESLVRVSITVKCADESKMARKKQSRRASTTKQNIPSESENSS